MKFTRLNGKKVLLRLLINLSISSIFMLSCYAIAKKHDDLPDDPWILPILIYGVGLYFFLLFYFAGRHSLRISRKLFGSIHPLGLFDNNECFIAYLNKESQIFYTQECLCGKIDGYPVIISFNLSYGRESSKLDSEVITIKFNRPHTELTSVALNWLRGYKPKRDIRTEVFTFIRKLKSKSVMPGTFEEVIADGRLSLAEDNYNAGI